MQNIILFDTTGIHQELQGRFRIYVSVSLRYGKNGNLGFRESILMTRLII